MPFRTFCDSEDKTCRKDIEPLIDKKTNKVFCPECNLEINSVNQFMKTQLASMGQVRRESADRTPYAIECKGCKNKKSPKLGPQKEILCAACGLDMTNSLNAPFAALVREAFKKRV